jgi:hypothetical protein
MGKPLISDAAMRGMFATMQQLRVTKQEVRGLSRAAKAVLQSESEAMPAAVLSQLNRRDTLVMEGKQPLFETARQAWFADESAAPPLVTCSGSSEECAAVAAGIAIKQSRGGTQKPVVIAVLRTFPALTGVLKLIEEHTLSLLVIVQGEAESRTDSNHRAAATKVPILGVDDQDAVAVCRVMQESMLRARHGWGGAVIHATQLPGAPDGLEGMRQRMERRGLLP